MGNEESKNISDTRGRPRSEDLNGMVDKVEYAFMKNKLPVVFPSNDPRKLATRLRLSTSFKEMEEELGTSFRILNKDQNVVVCLRK